VSESIRITLQLPNRSLAPNGRTHWRVKARATRTYRQVAHYYTAAEMQANAVAGGWTAAEVEAAFWFPMNRGRDADNLLASLKAAFDGIADAGLVSNDRQLTYLPVRQAIDRERPRVEITIRRTA
jgi:Holliday junction resolvase RusA-like endonuclease